MLYNIYATMIFDGHDYKTWLNQNRSIEPRRQRLKSTRMLSNVIFVSV